MSVGKRFLAATVAATAFMAASSASATVYVATYTGTVASGYDETGEFGAANTHLDGKAFTATYTYDASLGADESVPGVSEQLFGGSAYDTATPILDAMLEIGGVTIHVPGGYVGRALAEELPNGLAIVENVSQEYYDYVDYTSVSERRLSTIIFSPDVISTLPTSISLDGTYDLPGEGGYYDNYYQNYATGESYSNAIYFNTDHLTISAAVPEPASWALMILGFGSLGVALRRRRHLGSAAA